MYRKGIVRVLFVLSLIVLLCITLTSQNAIRGIVVMHADKSPIPYVNIGIPDKDIGTLTDINGNFFLDVRRSTIKNPQIKFSAIGFESVEMDYEDLLQRDSIFMIPKNYEIENIDIKSKPLGKEVTLGKRIDKKVAEIALGSSAKLGYEIGTKIKIKQKVWIKSVHFGLSDSTSDSILFRVHVYEMTNDVDVFSADE